MLGNGGKRKLSENHTVRAVVAITADERLCVWKPEILVCDRSINQTLF